MATIKSYTDLEQSRKLAEILPFESADMFWLVAGNTPRVHVLTEPLSNYSHWENYPCWSLAALINSLPKDINIEGKCYAPCLFPVQDKWLLRLWYNSNYIFTSPIAIFSDNPIDACYEFILKLHELNLL